MRGLAWIVMLGTVGCTAPNPAYRAEGAESGLGPTTGDTGLVETSAGEGSTGVEQCELHPARPLQISVSRGDQPIVPPCDGSILSLGAGNSIFEGNTIIHPECLPTDDSCLCGGTDVNIVIDGLDAFPAGVPSCGPVLLWSMQGPAGCEWGGVLMQAEGDIAPGFIAARAREVPPLGPTFQLGLDPEGASSLCTGECQPDSPGRYALDVLGTQVMADGTSHYVEAAFLPGAPLRYLFENRMSSVSPDCQERVAWVAVLDPP